MQQVRQVVCPGRLPLRCSCGGWPHGAVFLLPRLRREVPRSHPQQAKIRAAHAKKFREKTIKGYIKELDGIKAKQEKLFQELKPLGEAILHPCEAPPEEGSK